VTLAFAFGGFGFFLCRLFSLVFLYSLFLVSVAGLFGLVLNIFSCRRFRFVLNDFAALSDFTGLSWLPSHRLAFLFDSGLLLVEIGLAHTLVVDRRHVFVGVFRSGACGERKRKQAQNQNQKQTHLLLLRLAFTGYCIP
jgi:hypothetical protein